MAKKRGKKKRGKPSAKRSITKRSHHRQKEEMERAQVWSVDVMLAVVIFVAVILVFYIVINTKQEPQLTDLETEATHMKIELEKNHELGFIINDEIDEGKLKDFIANATPANYPALKDKLGIKGDFCIFYEDANGNIILIGNKTGIGHSSVQVGGYPCGQDIPVP